MKMKRKAVMAMCGLGTSTIDRYMERGFFPKITPLTKVWESNDIKLWVKSHGKGPLGYTYGYASGTWPTWDEIVADARKQNDIEISKVSERSTESLRKEATRDFELSLEEARNKAQAELNQKHEGAVNLRYVAERLRDIKNMDEVEAFYKECVYNMGINTLRNGEADG
tara:strand:- start:2663 stop:3166 length:504 start_codon:yes stop_codon:yes gene_type:complete